MLKCVVFSQLVSYGSERQWPIYGDVRIGAAKIRIARKSDQWVG